MRLRLFVTISVVLAAVVLSTVVIYDRLEGFNTASDQVVGPAEGDDEATEAELGGEVRGGDRDQTSGELRVDGTVTVVHLDGAVPEPATVPTPLTLVSERGFGNGGEITGVTVGSEEDSAIVWDGGRPFVLSSGPGLVLEPVAVDLTEEGLSLSLGRAKHALEPGTYRLNTPVAVGTAGVATPRDSVTFTAGRRALRSARQCGTRAAAGRRGALPRSRARAPRG